MLKKEFEIVKIIKRLRKTKILVDQKIKKPEDRIKMYNSKKMVIDLESSSGDNYQFMKKKNKIPNIELPN